MFEENKHFHSSRNLALKVRLELEGKIDVTEENEVAEHPEAEDDVVKHPEAGMTTGCHCPSSWKGDEIEA